MTRPEIRAVYETRRQHFASLLSKTNEQINLISNARLVTALAFIILFYFSFTIPYLGYATAVTLLLFLFLVKRHALLFNEKTHLENLVRINAAEGKALSGDYATFQPGTSFIDPRHPYTHDLDIFGTGSLFQYLNRCNTLNGQKQFAQGLAHPLTEASAIRSQQEAVKELSTRTDFRQHFQAAGMEAGEQAGDQDQLLEWLRQPAFLRNQKSLGIILVVIPALTVLAVVTALFIPHLKLAATGLILVQWIITGTKLKKINVFHEYISQKKSILQKYARLLHYLEKEQFTSSRLRQLSSQAHEADEKVKKLASLIHALNARTNVMMTFIVNSLLLYDLQCVYRLEKWKEENAAKLPVWLKAINETEVLCSYGTFAFNNPSFSYATIHPALSIQAHDLAHPLIDENERVPNTLIMGPSPAVFIVTGANMAGKSTFLRTLGVNLILALNGAPVCATSFHCPVINLRTGMRTADSLQDHQSYFYAELNRLKTIMDELRSDKPLLILLDEILKGTNSTDKQAGSMALVKQLLPHPCLAIIATHDLALGDLEKEYSEQVKNYCFEASIENDQLSFDYKLKPGLAQKMNASFLMKKMGIIP